MSFLEYLVSQEKSGSITKKDALDMKMNYLSLNQKERDELDGQYSIKKTETSATKKNSIVESEKKTTKEEVVSKEVNKENAFSEKLLVNFMKGISPNNYQLIFDSYYVFLKNKFGQNKEVDDIIEEAAKKQLRDGEAEKFYNEYINRKIKENSNYDNQIDSEIKKKVLHPKKKTKKVSNVNRSGLYLDAAMLSVYVVVLKIFTLPIIVIKNAIKEISIDEKRQTSLPLLVFNKQLFEALIILCWPIYVLIIIYLNSFDNDFYFNQIFKDSWVIFYVCLIIYLTPVAIAITKEVSVLFLIIVLKLEDISKKNIS